MYHSAFTIYLQRPFPSKPGSAGPWGREPFGTNGTFLWGICPSCHANNSVKAQGVQQLLHDSDSSAIIASQKFLIDIDVDTVSFDHDTDASSSGRVFSFLRNW